MEIQKITIINFSKPVTKDINEELQWFGSSLGLFNLRDRDSSCFRIFIELIKAARLDKGLSSDELAYRLHLSRGTIVHHLKKLRASGLVVLKHSRYQLRARTLESMLGEVKKDLERNYMDLKEVAQDIDKKLSFSSQ